MKKLLKKRLNQKGLTLIELLAVIVILAIVAAIAIPAIGNLIENSRIKAAKADAITILNSVNLYEASEGALATGNTITIATDGTVNETAFEDFENYLDTTGQFDTNIVIKYSVDGPTLSGTWDNGVEVVFLNALLANIDPNTTDADTGLTINR